MNKNTKASPRHHGARSRNCVASRDQALATNKCQERGNLLRVAQQRGGGAANTKKEEKDMAGRQLSPPRAPPEG